MSSLWQRIVSALPTAPIDADGKKNKIWSDRNYILCETEECANHIADLLDATEYTAITGYFDPKEEEKHDAVSGFYYVDID